MNTKDTNNWPVGLQNPAGKFLTAEDFGFELNVLGQNLGRKQTWIIELNTDETACMKNHIGRYLTADKYGSVKCESETQTDDGKFTIEYSPDGTGRWTFKNVKYGNYLGGSDKKVTCLSKNGSEEEMSIWCVPMATHPHFVLYSKRQKRYFGLENDHIQCKEGVPWGSNSVFILEFCAGKCLIRTTDNRYLRKDGHLTETREAESRFTLEFRINKESKLQGVSFMDNEGKYLSGVGTSPVVLKSKDNKITDNEIFRLEASLPQVVITTANGNNASIRTGFELAAKSKQQTMKETFQIEYDKPSGKWYILSNENKYWLVNKNNGIEATADKRSPDCLFQFEWQCGSVSMIGSNGKNLGILSNGQMVAKNSGVGDNETFKIRIINRPLLVLKCELGFVGRKKTTKLEEYSCNKSVFEILTLEPGENGTYYIKGDNGKYWNMNDTAVIASSDKPEPFILEIMGECLMAILAPNNKYIGWEKSGGFRAITQVIQKSCLWQF